LDEGHEVVCVDSLLTSVRSNISHCLSNPRFSFVQCDISKNIPVSGVVDLLLHFASPASPKDYLSYPLETLSAGSDGTLNVLEVA
jgi:dTDP-glucose 4,6-dehydratase